MLVKSQFVDNLSRIALRSMRATEAIPGNPL
jgi:hypothetical protein